MPKYKLPNGTELFYEIFLSTEVGGSPWLIFISGLGDSSVIWGDYVKKLRSEGYNVLIFDNRDSGQSSLNLDSYTLNDMAVDLILLMNALKIEKAHLVGHSMGATIAQFVSTNDPNKVQSLTLIAGSPSPKFINLDLINSWVKNFKSRVVDDVESDEAYKARLKEVFPYVFSASFLADSEKISSIVNAAVSYPHRQKFSAYARQFSAIVATPEVEKNYNGPVLLIAGSEDSVVFAILEVEFLKKFPQAKRIVIKGMRHCVNIEAAERCVTDISDFLNS